MQNKERLERVYKQVKGLSQRIPDFGYQVVTDEVLTQPSRWRPVRRITYSSNLDGKELKSDRDILRDEDGTYTLAITPDEEAIFLFQVRPGLARPYQVELPAGVVKRGTDPAENVKKELAEETGVANEITPISLGVGPLLSGRTPQETHFHLVRGVDIDVARQRLDDGELIIPFTVPLDEALLLTTTIMHNRFNADFPNIGVDPTIVTSITLAAQYFAEQGEMELARRLLIL